MGDIKTNIEKMYQDGEIHVKLYENVLQKFLHWIQTKGIKIVLGLLFLWIGFKIIRIVVKSTNRFFEKRNIDRKDN